MSTEDEKQPAAEDEDIIQSIYEKISSSLDEIRGHFKVPVKVTCLVRIPDVSDCDIVVTDDDLNVAIGRLNELKTRPIAACRDSLPTDIRETPAGTTFWTCPLCDWNNTDLEAHCCDHCGRPRLEKGFN